jgi:hypothetical protein
MVALGVEELVSTEGVGEWVATPGGEGVVAPLVLPLPLEDGSQVCVPAKEMVVEKREVALGEGVLEGHGVEVGVKDGSVEEEGDKEGSGEPLALVLEREV